MQKTYHNYKIGTVIFPRDNSFQKLIETLVNWDGKDMTNDLYLKPCKVVSAEYTFIPTEWYFNGKPYSVVNVEYNGAVYRVNVSEFWDMTQAPDSIDYYEDEDYYDGEDYIPMNEFLFDS